MAMALARPLRADGNPMNMSEQLPTAPRRLELIDDLSFRFWEISVEGSFIRRRFGLIGRPWRTILVCLHSLVRSRVKRHED